MTNIINNTIKNTPIVCPEEGANVTNCKDGTVPSIQGGAGVDFIQNDGFIFGPVNSGGGDTTVINTKAIRGNITLGAGNNLVINNGMVVYIDEETRAIKAATEEAEAPSIIGGSGTDKIINAGVIASSIIEDEGNNYVANKGTLKKIQCGVGDNTVINDGAVTNIIENTNEEGKVVKTEEGLILVGNGNNEIVSTGSVGNIQVGDGNNKITNYGICIKISTGAGNNEVVTGVNSTTSEIAVGNGNNIIENTGTVETINMGTGDNVITNYGKALTINIGTSKNMLVTATTSTANVINMPASGSTTLVLNAKKNNLVFGYEEKAYVWDEDDLVIIYNEATTAIIKNYNPRDTEVAVYVDGDDLSTIAPPKGVEIIL